MHIVNSRKSSDGSKMAVIRFSSAVLNRGKTEIVKMPTLWGSLLNNTHIHTQSHVSQVHKLLV